MLRKIVLGIVLIIAALAAGFVFWASRSNPLMPAVESALQSDSIVAVEEAGDWLVFRPRSSAPQTGLVFYPGGKVNYRAYAPYAREIAEQGSLVVIVKMPLNLAVLNPAAADAVISAYPEVQEWAVGGHSLGGAMAANYAADHLDQVRGLLLLAAYPAGSDDLSNTSLSVVSIYGDQDGVASLETIDASRALLPESTRFVVIEGGNHAQFGDYGDQSGDNPAGISRDEQQRLAVQVSVELLQSLSTPSVDNN